MKPWVVILQMSLLSYAAPVNEVGAVIGRRSAQQEPNKVPTQARFLLALNAAHVAGGSVWIRTCNSNEPVFPEEQTMPLHTALDKIVLSDPAYRWQTENGVVNLLPRAGEPQLLKLRIKVFQAKGTTNEALRQLLMLPELNKEAARLGLKRIGGGLLVGPSPSG